MVRESFNGYVPPAYANNALDHANVDAVFMKDRALLDMQFQERGDISGLARREIQATRISANMFDTLPDRHAAVTDYVKRCVGQFANHRAAAGQTAFFISKTDNLYRVTCCDATFMH